VELSLGERRHLERLRKQQNQHEAAADHGVTRWQYQRELERDPGDIQEVRIADYEWCRIMRWRANKSQREVAEDLKVSRPWITLMENGQVNCDDLIWYWEH
jgi:transcriptional regulator with XRE-family HTH domain